MKKTFCILFTIFFVLLTFGGCSAKSDIKVDAKEFNDRVLYNKISNSTYKKLFRDTFANEDDFKNYYESVVLPESTDDVKKSFVEDEAIINDCKKKGIYVSKDSAKKNAKKEYELMKTDETQENFYKILKSVISENNISETDYIELLYDRSYSLANRRALKSYFNKNIYKGDNDSSDKDSLNKQFQKYVDTLVK